MEVVVSCHFGYKKCKPSKGWLEDLSKLLISFRFLWHFWAAMSLFPSWAICSTMTQISDLVTALNVPDPNWDAFTHQAGDPGEDVRLLAALPSSSLDEWLQSRYHARWFQLHTYASDSNRVDVAAGKTSHSCTSGTSRDRVCRHRPLGWTYRKWNYGGRHSCCSTTESERQGVENEQPHWPTGWLGASTSQQWNGQQVAAGLHDSDGVDAG